MGASDYGVSYSTPVSMTSSTTKSRKAKSAEEKAAAKARKSQQDDLDALQITFYEIESWIEKTAPVLTRMTNELDKASVRFEKQRQERSTYDRPVWQTHQPTIPSTDSPIDIPHTTMNKNGNSNSDSNKDNNMSTSCTQTQPTSSQAPPPEEQHRQQKVYPLTKEQEDSMQWVLSFQPGNSLRLETNITSVEQLVDAVQKMRLLSEPTSSPVNEQNDASGVCIASSTLVYASIPSSTSSSSSSSSSLSIPWTGSDQLRLGPSTEYWCTALQRRPRSCLEDYKDCDELNLGKLTENVSPHVLNYACQQYWTCLHPKFSNDWSSFWDRSGDPKRNQVCIDSGLAMVFLHIIRHHKDSCPNANDIGYYYYERAREALMDYFDSPDYTTLETLMNLAMFCILCKRHSQARIHIGLAYRMILDMGIHQQSNWPKEDLLLRKKHLKLFMVLYYNDITVSMYSGEPTQLNDTDIDVDFYDLITVNQFLQPPPDEKTMIKETFFVHLLSLAKIGKRTLLLMEDYQRQHEGKQHIGALPLSWANKVQGLEVALATWFERLPGEYRVDPQPATSPATSSLSTAPVLSPATPTTMSPSQSSTSSSSPPLQPSLFTEGVMDVSSLRKQSAYLLMLQYQTQWILLHKTFANIDPSPLSATVATAAGSTSIPIPPQGADRSREICTDAANRIVVMAELITEEYGWCVCQQFISCIYQASTIYCRNALSLNEDNRQHAKIMIKRIIRVLGSSRINYSGLPDDVTACLNDFLVNNGMQPPSSAHQDHSENNSSSIDSNDGHDDVNDTAMLNGCQLLDQWVSFSKQKPVSTSETSSTPTSSISTAHALEHFNDSLYNSPHQHLACLHQQPLHRPPLTARYHQTDAMLSIKIQEPVVDNSMAMDFQLEHRKNWRNMFSSSNITQVNQRML